MITVVFYSVRAGGNRRRNPLVLQVRSAEQASGGGAESDPQGADPDLLWAAGLSERAKGTGL